MGPSTQRQQPPRPDLRVIIVVPAYDQLVELRTSRAPLASVSERVCRASFSRMKKVAEDNHSCGRRALDDASRRVSASAVVPAEQGTFARNVAACQMQVGDEQRVAPGPNTRAGKERERFFGTVATTLIRRPSRAATASSLCGPAVTR